MAESLAVIGIIANIVQLVDFSTRVLHRFHEFQLNVKDIPVAFRQI